MLSGVPLLGSSPGDILSDPIRSNGFYAGTSGPGNKPEGGKSNITNSNYLCLPDPINFSATATLAALVRGESLRTSTTSSATLATLSMERPSSSWYNPKF